MASLTWLPDETIFSFCSRWHAVSGHSVAHQTTKDIFQHHRRGSAHDLPTRLNFFASRFKGTLGDAESTALEHTILPFFLPFLNTARQRKAIQIMCGDHDAHLKYQLGLLNNKQGAAHPLKACASCIIKDMDTFGAAYWHLSHQLPGSGICLQHQSPLLIAKEKVSGVKRFQWLLPKEAHYVEPEIPQGGSFDCLLKFEQALQDYFKIAKRMRSIEPSKVADVNIRQLGNLGFLRGDSGTSVDWKAASEEFLKSLFPLRKSPYISFIPTTSRTSQLLLRRVLVPKVSVTHPLNFLLFIVWAFDCWSAFEDRYSENPKPRAGPEPHPVKRDQFASIRQSALKLLSTGKSARSTALRVGVDTQTVICWGRAAGIDIEQRSKTSKIADIALAKRLLGTGEEKKIIESKTDLSRATINRLLRSDTDLAHRWTSKRSEMLVAKRRGLWLKISQSNPTLSTQQIRLIEPSIYAWLYRNDRDWLLTRNASTNTGSSGNNSSVNWDQRDLDFAKAVEDAALRLSNTYPGQKITRSLLVRSVPELERKIKHLSRMPKTTQALAAALNPRRQRKNNNAQFSLPTPEAD